MLLETRILASSVSHMGHKSRTATERSLVPVMSDEQSPLLPGSSSIFSPNIRKAGHVSRPGHVSIWRVVFVFVFLVIPLILLIDVELPEIPFLPGPKHSEQHLCPQADPLYPVANANVARKVLNVLDSRAFLEKAVQALSGAVQIA